MSASYACLGRKINRFMEKPDLQNATTSEKKIETTEQIIKLTFNFHKHTHIKVRIGLGLFSAYFSFCPCPMLDCKLNQSLKCAVCLLGYEKAQLCEQYSYRTHLPFIVA